VRDLRHIVKKHNIQVVHAHQAVEGLHLYLATLGLSGVKRVLSFHGFIADRKNQATLKFLIPRMDANLVVSGGLKDSLKADNQLDTDNFEVLYNGADPARLQAAGSSVRSELGISSTATVLGMVANFYRDPRKDQLTVVKALRENLSKLPDTHFLFVGRVESGAEEYFNECRRICVEAGMIDRVHFLGPRNDIPDVLAALDIFVLSSLHEGLPISLLEAMLVHLPCIASDIPQHLEVSNEGKCIALFRTGDPTELGKRLVELVVDPDTRMRWSDAAFEYAQGNFSIAAHIENLKKLYGRLLKV
jgi:glycosyltransferase involved in cell wall biosynthesis